jgi:hypothetical protein
MANLAHEADIHDNGPNIRSGSNFLVQATATAGQKQTMFPVSTEVEGRPSLNVRPRS